MLKKWFHSESKTIVGAALVVGVLSFISRIVGLIRDRMLAGAFGAGDLLDVYYAAFKLPDLLFGLMVVGALSASFIPLFSKFYHGALGKKRAWEFTNNTLHLVFVGMILVSIGLLVCASPLASLVAPGFSAAKQASVATFMRVMIPAQILLAVSMVFGSVLQGVKRFFLYSLAPVFYNVGIIVGAVWFTQWLGPIGLAWGVVFGAVLHLLIQCFGAFNAGYRYLPKLTLRDKESISLIRMMGPRVLGIGLSQIHLLILTVIASTLAVGSVTVFQFAYNIQFFPVGIIGIAYAVAAFPTFSERLQKGDTKGFIETFSTTIRQLLFLMIPMMVLFLVVRAQITRVVVGAGLFDWNATLLTADTLAFFAISLIPQALVFILARAFFSLHDTWTPFATGLASTVLGLVSALWFTDRFGVMGLALAYSLAAFVNAGLLWVTLRQRIGSLGEARMLTSFYKLTVAGMAAGVVMQVLKPYAMSLFGLSTFFGVFLQGFLAGGAGLIVYAFIAFLLKSEEFSEFLSGIRKRMFKTSKPEESVPIESTTIS